MGIVKALSKVRVTVINNSFLCYIDLDANNNYSIYIKRSDDNGIEWTDPVLVESAIAITSFDMLINVVGQIIVYFSKVVTGQLKLYFRISEDGGLTFGDKIEVI